MLLRRRAAGSRAPHGDGARIALCVEGGAMRGVLSAGMVSALEELGLTQAFDAAYGSSAGALNAAYFLAGQATVGSRIYYEDINNARFIDLRRGIIRRPIVDLGYLIDDVAVRRKPLDADRVIHGPTPLTVLATNAATSERLCLRNFANPRALFDALRAGATMPIIAGGAFRCGDVECFDASLTEPVPVPSAEADGFTHILVLLTRPSDHPRALSAFDRYYVLPRLRRISAELAQKYTDRSAPYRALMSHIDHGTGPLGRAHVLGIKPAPPSISKLERRREVLIAGAKRGHDAVMRVFRQG